MAPSNSSVGNSVVSHLTTYFFLALFSLSLLGNVIQAWKIRSFQRSGLDAGISGYALPTGTIVPTFSVATVSGQRATLSFRRSKKTVIYIFDPHCHWCARNLPNILFLANQKGNAFNFVGLSRTSQDLGEYVSQSKLPFPVYVDSLPKDLAVLAFAGTPQTVIVDKNGKIERNWAGAYSGPLQSKIEEYFGVKLPGLRPTPHS